MAESYSFFPDVDEILTSAFELIRVYDAGSSNVPLSTQRTRAIQALNFMLTGWQSDGLQLWSRKTTSFSLTLGTTSYTIGSGGTINVNKPMRIYNAWRRDTDNDTDVPIKILSEKEYDLLNNKSEEGTPTAIYYDNRYESNAVQEGTTAKGLIYVYQPANSDHVSNSTIHIRYQRPFNDFTATTDTIDFPQEWMEAVKYGLAVRLAPVYGVPMLEYDRLKKMAEEIKEIAMSNDVEDTSVFLFPAKY